MDISLSKLRETVKDKKELGALLSMESQRVGHD